MSQASASVKVMRSASPSASVRRRPSSTTASRGVDAVHPRHVAEADQEPHSRPVAATEIDARHPVADARLLGQVHRRAEAADMDLLAHDQFPQLALPGRCRRPARRSSRRPVCVFMRDLHEIPGTRLLIFDLADVKSIGSPSWGLSRLIRAGHCLERAASRWLCSSGWVPRQRAGPVSANVHAPWLSGRQMASPPRQDSVIVAPPPGR